jgi:hypothetical protein
MALFRFSAGFLWRTPREVPGFLFTRNTGVATAFPDDWHFRSLLK